MSFMKPVKAADPAISRDRFRAWQLVLLLVGFGLFMASRLPEAWTHGRFLDEEVTVFFAYAWNFGPADALFRSFAGYWNLAANTITMLLAAAVRADLMSLERAPYVTMSLGLAAQLLPILLLLTLKADWLARRSTRLVAAFLVVLTPGADEIYLNVVHIQFHLALCVGILLTLDAPSRPSQKLLAGTILLLAPLCGPGAILLLPLFVLRALVDRDMARAVQGAILAAGSAIQLLLFYAPSAARGLPLDPTLLAAGMFVRLVVQPVFGPLAAVIVGGQSFKADAAGNIIILPLLGITAVLCFAMLVRWSLQRRDGAIWAVAAGLLVAILSLGLGAAGQSNDAHRFALMPLAGPRYNYIPVVLLALATLILANRSGACGPRFANMLVILYLAIGALFFRIALPAYSDGVSWPSEVAQWRADPTYQLRAWPLSVKADLSGRPFPCPADAVAPGNPAHPRYCESGWIAGFYTAPANNGNLPLP